MESMDFLRKLILDEERKVRKSFPRDNDYINPKVNGDVSILKIKYCVPGISRRILIVR